MKLPAGLDGVDEPYLPDLGRLYWVTPPLLDADDGKSTRPVVVVVVPDDVYGEITFVIRSSTEENGQEHAAQRAHGLSKKGWFSRIRTRSAQLWTPETAKSLEYVLDDETLSYVMRGAGV